MTNPVPNAKPFTKGDPRINRKGRPRSFDALRELAQDIAHEIAMNPNSEPIIINGHKATVAEVMVRKLAMNKDPRYQLAFLEIAFGKVPTRNEITGADGGAIIIDWGDNAPGDD